MPRLLPLTTAFVVVLGLTGASAILAAPVRTEHVEAELVADRTTLSPGRPLTVALRLEMERGWHTYWQNPGDSGLPTTLAWKLPQGLRAGPIQWPAPHALPVPPLVNYGYEGEVLLLNEISTAADFVSGATTTLNARADWLVCKEICIPEGADLSLTLPVAGPGAPNPRWSGPIAKARAAQPRPLEGWTVAAAGQGQKIELILTPSASTAAGDPGNLRFFPFSEGKIEPSGEQTLLRDGAAFRLALPVASHRVGEFTRVAGVLTSTKGLGGGSDAATIDVPLAGTVVAGPPPASASQTLVPTAMQNGAGNLGLAVALVFALVGGVLLNLMPCVFPVLSLKVLGFAKHGGGPTAMRAHGLAFAAGVIASFWLLAFALLAFRVAGQQLGWGFQLQSPMVISLLAVLFFVLALNLSGVFEIGQLIPSGLSTWNARNPHVNDALSGTLAVIVASPCSAPFMGAALGYALAESAATTLTIFTGLGLGMALPYLLLAFFPAWRTKIPQPGAWMVRLKQLLAFPLYGTVVWLAWVLGAQLDNDAVARLGAMLLLIALALWAWRMMRDAGARAWGVAAVASIAGAIAAGWPLVVSGVTGDVQTAKPAVSAAEATKGPWQNFAPGRVAGLTAAGRAVFVDFTAAWCVTCQVNKRLVLNTDAVQQAFARSGVVLMRGDWTRRDPVITAALTALGRNGVPVYVLYRPGREPLILPEVLQKTTIIDALGTL